MAIEIRAARSDEIGQLGLMGAYVFGGTFGDGEDNAVSQGMQPEWTLCAFDGPRLITSYAAFPFTIRANGAAMPMGGVTIVGTLPEYRRRGLLRKITNESFAQMRANGQASAGLWASQAAIYQRYGYAAYGPRRHYRIDTVDLRLLQEPSAGYTVEHHDAESVFPTLKTLYREFADQRTGYIHRSRPLWNNNVLETKPEDGPVFAAICSDPSGTPVGYMAYTLRGGRVDNAARNQEFTIRDNVWLDTEAQRAMIAFVASHDLVGRVLFANMPVDDPTPELLMEPRLLHPTETDGLWWRVVDVPRALELRGYDAMGELTVNIVGDDIADWNNGTWRLTASPEGAQVVPASGPADISLSIKALSSLASGARSARQLARWSMLEGDAHAVQIADQLFATKSAPHCPDHF